MQVIIILPLHTHSYSEVTGILWDSALLAYTIAQSVVQLWAQTRVNRVSHCLPQVLNRIKLALFQIAKFSKLQR